MKIKNLKMKLKRLVNTSRASDKTVNTDKDITDKKIIETKEDNRLVIIENTKTNIDKDTKPNIDNDVDDNIDHNIDDDDYDDIDDDDGDNLMIMIILMII